MVANLFSVSARGYLDHIVRFLCEIELDGAWVCLRLSCSILLFMVRQCLGMSVHNL
jgi:hypothetical protein